MVSLTLAITPEMKQRMDAFEEINWSSVARNAIKEKIDLLERFREFTKDSTLTEEDAIRRGRKVNRAAAKRFHSLLTQTSSSQRSSKKA